MHAKKIVIVTDAWHPQINGVVTTLVQTIACLKQDGFVVETVTPERFKTVPCPTYPEIALSLTGASRLQRIIVDAAPSAVHIATEGPLGWAARRACLRLDIPYTTSYHTRFPEYIRMRFPVPLRLSYAIMKKFHNRAACVMAATEQLKSELLARGFARVKIWSRGVDTSLFRPRSGRVFPGEEPVFTYLGRVAPEKNIEAFLALDLPGRKCVIGDGPLLPELVSRYPGTTFLGLKTGEELARHLAASDVFVFPSLTDTFGVVQLEALASGVPVAAYPVAGPQSLISNGRNGWLDQDLRVAALKCLEVPAEHCRTFALARSWQKCTRQFAENLCFFKDSAQPNRITGSC